MNILKEEHAYLDCRYSGYLPKYLENCEVIEDKSRSDYSGDVDVTFYDKSTKTYYHVCYYYGSCSGCDSWEADDLSDEEITKEIESLILKMNEEEYKAWKARIEKE